MALVMTLTTLAPNITTAQGNGPWPIGGHGTPGAAKAVSKVVSITPVKPHVPTPVALAGITEGAKNNIVAIRTVLTILRSFIVAPAIFPCA